MQSSGASTLAFLLAQKPDCAAFVDIWALYAAPSLPGADDVVAKVVVTTAFPLALHRERFRPDRTILFLRHPEANYRSLATKGYRHHCGFLEEKFSLLDQVFVTGHGFDVIVYYEDLVVDPLGTLARMTDLGWPCTPEFLRLGRRHSNIKELNERRYPEIVDRLEYDVGNHHGSGLTQDFAKMADLPEPGQEVCRWCPAVSEHYRLLMQQPGQPWAGLCNPATLTDSVSASTSPTSPSGETELAGTGDDPRPNGHSTDKAHP